MGVISLLLASVVASSFSIIGHRGARDIWPENTVTSLYYATEAGADEIEFDLHFTKDDDIVVMHDPYVPAHQCLDKNGNKIKNKKHIVRTMTILQLKEFDCGSLRSNKRPLNLSPQERIPTFQESVIAIRNAMMASGRLNVKYKIEIKSNPKKPDWYPAADKIAELVLNQINLFGIKNDSIIQSFDHNVLSEIRKRDNEIELAVLWPSTMSEKAIAKAKELSASTVSPHYLALNFGGAKKWVQKLHDAGLKLIPWTVNSEKNWKKLIAVGVDGIITDDPERLKTFYGTLQPMFFEPQSDLEKEEGDDWDPESLN